MSELVYAAIGAAYLWPWNCFITASMFVGPYLHDYPGLQRSYASCVMLASTVVNLSTSSYLALNPTGFGRRVRFGQITIAAGFVLLSLVTWLSVAPRAYFYCILFFVCFISVGTTNVQNGVTAITQAVPGGKEARAVLVGQAFSGIVPPIFGLALSLGGNHRAQHALRAAVHSVVHATDPSDSTNFAIILFLSSALLCGYVLYAWRGATVQDHIDLSQQENVLDEGEHSLWHLARAIYAPATGIFMSFVVSLSFSVFANAMTSTTIPAKYFVPLTILLWNAGDLAGRILCESERFQIKNPATLIKYAYARFVFIPALLLLAWLGNPSDLLYMLVMALYGVTNGHLFSASISLAPLCVAVEQRAAAGGLIGMIISVGLVSGALFSFAVIPMVDLF